MGFVSFTVDKVPSSEPSTTEQDRLVSHGEGRSHAWDKGKEPAGFLADRSDPSWSAVLF